MDKHEHISVCVVQYPDWANGSKMLLRIADLSKDETALNRAHIDESLPKKFDNRDFLYGKEHDGPDQDDAIGVWGWTATQRDNDDTKDYIDSTFESDKVPFEVIFYSAPSTHTLVEYMRNGIKVRYRGTRVLVYSNYDKKSYHCILCNETNCEFANGIITIKPETDYIYSYILNSQDVIDIDSCSLSLYRFFTIKHDPEKIFVKSHDDIVREIIKSKFSWSKAKGTVDSKRSWQNAKLFIESFSSDIIGDIAAACSCSKQEAEQLLRAFIVNGDSSIQTTILDYLSEDDLIRLLDQNQILKDRFQAAYDRENEQLQKDIDEKKVELQTLVNNVEKCRKDKEALDIQIDELTSKEREIKEIITHDQEVSDHAIEYLQNRVNEVRKDAASVIQEYPLFMNLFKASEESHETVNEQQAVNDNSLYGTATSAFTIGESLENREVVTDWKEQLELLDESLQEAGVNERYSPSLAKFLYVAHIYQIPVLLAGPSGFVIADAVSSALYGKLSAQLDCDGCYNPTDIIEAQSVENNVVAIRSPFKTAWVDAVLSAIQNRSVGRDYYLLVPFADDLVIQPNGILNYAVPVLTELFVVREPSGYPVAGDIDEKFQDYKKCEKVKFSIPASIHLGPMAALKLRTLLAEASKLGVNIADTDFLYLFCVIPYLYVMNKKDVAVEMIQSEQNISKDVIKLVSMFGWME